MALSTLSLFDEVALMTKFPYQTIGNLIMIHLGEGAAAGRARGRSRSPAHVAALAVRRHPPEQWASAQASPRCASLQPRQPPAPNQSRGALAILDEPRFANSSRHQVATTLADEDRLSPRNRPSTACCEPTTGSSPVDASALSGPAPNPGRSLASVGCGPGTSHI